MVFRRRSQGDRAALNPAGDATRLAAWADRDGAAATVADLRRVAKAARAIDTGHTFTTKIAKALGQPVPATSADMTRLADLAAAVAGMPEIPAGGLLEQIASIVVSHSLINCPSSLTL